MFSITTADASVQVNVGPFAFFQDNPKHKSECCSGIHWSWKTQQQIDELDWCNNTCPQAFTHSLFVRDNNRQNYNPDRPKQWPTKHGYIPTNTLRFILYRELPPLLCHRINVGVKKSLLTSAKERYLKPHGRATQTNHRYTWPYYTCQVKISLQPVHKLFATLYYSNILWYY